MNSSRTITYKDIAVAMLAIASLLFTPSLQASVCAPTAGAFLGVEKLSEAVIDIANNIATKTSQAVSNATEGCSRVGQPGRASYYGVGDGFAGRRTASGERFDPNAMTVAHPTLPMGTRVIIRDPATGRVVRARVNDRGPYSGGRIVDLSAGVFRQLAPLSRGVLRSVEVWRCS